MNQAAPIIFALAFAGLIATTFAGIRWHYLHDTPVSRVYACIAERSDRTGVNQKPEDEGLRACMEVFRVDTGK